MEYHFIPTRLAKIVKPESAKERLWYREPGAVMHYWRKDKMTSTIILEKGFAECNEIMFLCALWPSSLAPGHTLLRGLECMFKRGHIWDVHHTGFWGSGELEMT